MEEDKKSDSCFITKLYDTSRDNNDTDTYYRGFSDSKTVSLDTQFKQQTKDTLLPQYIDETKLNYLCFKGVVVPLTRDQTEEIISTLTLKPEDMAHIHNTQEGGEIYRKILLNHTKDKDFSNTKEKTNKTSKQNSSHIKRVRSSNLPRTKNWTSKVYKHSIKNTTEENSKSKNNSITKHINNMLSCNLKWKDITYFNVINIMFCTFIWIIHFTFIFASRCILGKILDCIMCFIHVVILGKINI